MDFFNSKKKKKGKKEYFYQINCEKDWKLFGYWKSRSCFSERLSNNDIVQFCGHTRSR